VLRLATIDSFLRLEPERWDRYVLFGIATGLGLLSKYNFVLMFLALVLAGLCVPELRKIILNRKMLGSLAVALILCTPHLYWISQHRDLAFSSVQKLKLLEGSRWALPMARALGKWVLAIFAHLGIMLGIVLLLFHREIVQVRI
jgi:4-amino-4-deoxy-L-arabinose transferase-like glycosyltransferase